MRSERSQDLVTPEGDRDSVWEPRLIRGSEGLEAGLRWGTGPAREGQGGRGALTEGPCCNLLTLAESWGCGEENKSCPQQTPLRAVLGRRSVAPSPGSP